MFYGGISAQARGRRYVSCARMLTASFNTSEKLEKSRHKRRTYSFAYTLVSSEANVLNWRHMVTLLCGGAKNARSKFVH